MLTQKQADEKIHPLYYRILTINAAKGNYAAREMEVLVVMFALRKFRLYLLSTESFKLITDH